MTTPNHRATRTSRRRDNDPQPISIHPSSSWRMVETGDSNDSFDTSVLPAPLATDDYYYSTQPASQDIDYVDADDDDEVDFIVSSGSVRTGSQPFSISGGDSQPFSISGSQEPSQSQEGDPIGSFLTRAEHDERGDVLLRSPFRPSVPQSVRESVREEIKREDEGMGSSTIELRMPKVDVDMGGSGFLSSRRTSSSAVKTPSPEGLRRRKGAGAGGERGHDGGERGQQAAQGSGTSPGSVVLAPVYWVFGVLALAFRYAQKPLAILVSLYVTLGGMIVLQNMATQPLQTALSPLCRIPGAGFLDLPFCPVYNFRPGPSTSEPKEKGPVEFDSLMDVQDQFEKVLEKSAQGVSLPLEMKRSEASIRDLRTMVCYSNLHAKDELVLEFDRYIETARQASNSLQRFNTHVGSTVDFVISINRWTARYLDSLDASSAPLSSSDQGLIMSWASWLFSPFQPATFSERALLDKYIEHTSLVSEKIAELILEAQFVLRILSRAEDHLGIIHTFVARTQKTIQSRRDEILWTLWTLVGANSRRLESLNGQLQLLRKVDEQRMDAVKQVTELVAELERIQAGLGDLRERVAEPGLVRQRGVEVPLSVHIETINRGVERLEGARRRIREVENERIREVLARGKVDREGLIESA
ncbi:uncharacterized protein CTHT_0060570 [Thermochaetoides thermophila DSM 1495]|uniref:Uncharacterized protein n=1 Tax=Chaetomium thermophilum (strain DSM 1495 / CBS 144.50 / IMI 039719) TaxID=759272 RepID=G0SF26_CHATD|nr:hypothetical protein CTHT_0060570 [Thermochaetoides thermophila DSM 1495]EGS18042.1 hypothetical protein CTHT_0060570 [Thermochaetoides thermophila DSM 1495]